MVLSSGELDELPQWAAELVNEYGPNSAQTASSYLPYSLEHIFAPFDHNFIPSQDEIQRKSSSSELTELPGWAAKFVNEYGPNGTQNHFNKILDSPKRNLAPFVLENKVNEGQIQRNGCGKERGPYERHNREQKQRFCDLEASLGNDQAVLIMKAAVNQSTLESWASNPRPLPAEGQQNRTGGGRPRAYSKEQMKQVFDKLGPLRTVKKIDYRDIWRTTVELLNSMVYPPRITSPTSSSHLPGPTNRLRNNSSVCRNENWKKHSQEQ
jgi:hypothetical protein